MQLPTASAQPTPVLDYQAPGTTRPRLWPRLLVLAATAPLLAAPFAPFTYGVSPLAVVAECATRIARGRFDSEMTLGLLAAPFFVGILVWLWHLRQLRTARPPGGAERRSAVVLAVVTAGMNVLFAGRYFWEISSAGYHLEELLTVSAGLCVLVLGAVALACIARRPRPPHALPTLCLHAAYLANAVLCLIAFRDYHDIGWWLTLAGSAMLFGECVVIVAVALSQPRRFDAPPVLR
jgi:hypothetical protein